MRSLSKEILAPLAGLIGIAFVGVLIFASSTDTMSADASSKITGVEYSATHTYYSHDDMMKKADAIIVGEVTSISPARWNQESGEFWQDDWQTPLPYYEVKINVTESLADKLKVGPEVAITIIGSSSTGTDSASKVQVGGEQLPLQIGEQAVFFVRSGQIAWRTEGSTSGVRDVVMLLNVPDYSYLLKQADGRYRLQDPAEKEKLVSIEELREKVKKLR